jgi:hypothetical protein
MTETALGQVAAAVDATKPTTPTTETIPVAGPPPVAATQAPAPVAITLTPEQWTAYTASQTRISELEAAERTRVAASQSAEIEALQAKGRITDAFNLQRANYEATLAEERKTIAAIEGRSKRYALDGELARALASHPLVAGGAAQLTQLLRDEFTVEGRGDSIVVQSKDFRSVAAFIDAVLPSKFSHFLVARNPLGGTAGSTGTQSSPTAPAQGSTPEAPKTLMEGILRQMAEASSGTKDARTDLSVPFGFGGKVVKQA